MYRTPRRLRLEINPTDKSWIEECREDPKQIAMAVNIFDRLPQKLLSLHMQTEMEQAIDEANARMPEE